MGNYNNLVLEIINKYNKEIDFRYTSEKESFCYVPEK